MRFLSFITATVLSSLAIATPLSNADQASSDIVPRACNQALIDTFNNDIKFGVPFCQFWFSFDRTRSPIPGLSTQQVYEVCRCIIDGQAQPLARVGDQVANRAFLRTVTETMTARSVPILTIAVSTVTQTVRSVPVLTVGRTTITVSARPSTVTKVSTLVRAPSTVTQRATITVVKTTTLPRATTTVVKTTPLPITIARTTITLRPTTTVGISTVTARNANFCPTTVLRIVTTTQAGPARITVTSTNTACKTATSTKVVTSTVTVTRTSSATPSSTLTAAASSSAATSSIPVPSSAAASSSTNTRSTCSLAPSATPNVAIVVENTVYERFYRGCGFTEDPQNPGSAYYSDNFPTVTTTFNNTVSASDAVTECANQAYTRYPDPNQYLSFDLHFISTSGQGAAGEGGAGYWECVQYFSEQSDDDASPYFNVSNPAVTIAYGYSSGLYSDSAAAAAAKNNKRAVLEVDLVVEPSHVHPPTRGQKIGQAFISGNATSFV